MGSTLEILCDYIREELAFEGELDPDLDLLDEKILDSFGVVEIASFVQGHFKIELQGEDLVRENFAKLSSMVELIDRRSADD